MDWLLLVFCLKYSLHCARNQLALLNIWVGRGVENTGVRTPLLSPERPHQLSAQWIQDLLPSPPFAFHLHPSPPPPLGPPEGSPCLATSPLPHSHFSLRTATWSELPQTFPQYLLSPVHLRNQSSLWKLIPDVVTPTMFFCLSVFFFF